MAESSIEDLPEDPEQAFLFLEQIFAEECDAALEWANDRGSDEDLTQDLLRYMSRTLAATIELDLGVLQDWKLPSAANFDRSMYRDFRRDVQHVRTILEIRQVRTSRRYSVRLDAGTKEKIRHHLGQIRDIVDKLPLDDWKKEAIYDKIGALETEIDKDRTGFEKLGAMVIYMASIMGEAGVTAEPVRKWIDSIARLLWGLDIKEKTDRLPGPRDRKRIEPPRKQLPPPKRRGQLDDDIPF